LAPESALARLVLSLVIGCLAALHNQFSKCAKNHLDSLCESAIVGLVLTNKKNMKSSHDQNEDIYQDEWLVPRELREHPELLSSISEFTPEPDMAVRFEPIGLVERAVISYNKHRKGVKQVLGGLSIGTGFIVGGAVAAHHRH